MVRPLFSASCDNIGPVNGGVKFSVFIFNPEIRVFPIPRMTIHSEKVVKNLSIFGKELHKILAASPLLCLTG